MIASVHFIQLDLFAMRIIVFLSMSQKTQLHDVTQYALVSIYYFCIIYIVLSFRIASLSFLINLIYREHVRWDEASRHYLTTGLTKKQKRRETWLRNCIIEIREWNRLLSCGRKRYFQQRLFICYAGLEWTPSYSFISCGH